MKNRIITLAVLFVFASLTQVASPMTTLKPITRDNAAHLTLIKVQPVPASETQDFDGIPAFDHLQFSPDSKTLAYMKGTYKLHLWDVETGSYRVSMSYGNWSLNGAFSPDSVLVLTGGNPNLTVQRLDTGEAIRTLDGGGGLVSSAAFSPDGNLFAAGTWRGYVKVWSSSTFQEQYTYQYPGMVWGIAFSPNNPALAIAGGIYPRDENTVDQVRLWNPLNGDQIIIADKPNFYFRRVLFSPDGKTVATIGYKRAINGDQKGDIWLYNIQTGKTQPLFGGQLRSITDFAYNQDGSLLAVSSADAPISVWDTAAGSEIRTLTVEGSGALTFNADGTLLASVGQVGNTLILWDVRSGSELLKIADDGIGLNAVAFNADGTLLATGDLSGTIKLWGVAE
jgi:WD40 repeat protein